MPQYPRLETDRLNLRNFSMDDCDDVTRMVDDPQIAANTIEIPHPYEYHMAADWIKSHRKNFNAGQGVVFAITCREAGNLIGAIGLTINSVDNKAEMGYWIGREYWNKGYATEAGKAVVAYGFDKLGLHRIFGKHLRRNLASGKVMQKVGMLYEGRLREDVKKNGELEDLELYGMLKADYYENNNNS